MIKTVLYLIVASFFGAWLIYQLSTSPELSNTKSAIENRTNSINQLIDKLED